LRILGLLAVDGCLRKLHLRKRGLFAYVELSQKLTNKLRAIRHINLGQEESLPHRPAAGRKEPAPSQELVRTALIPENPI
jgi:hypothetical protein